MAIGARHSQSHVVDDAAVALVTAALGDVVDHVAADHFVLPCDLLHHRHHLTPELGCELGDVGDVPG